MIRYQHFLEKDRPQFHNDGEWVLFQEAQKAIQLLQMDPPISDVITEFEAAVSTELGRSVAVTSIKEKRRLRIDRDGYLRIRTAQELTFRPGPTPRNPLKVKVWMKAVGSFR